MGPSLTPAAVKPAFSSEHYPRKCLSSCLCCFQQGEASRVIVHSPAPSDGPCGLPQSPSSLPSGEDICPELIRTQRSESIHLSFALCHPLANTYWTDSLVLGPPSVTERTPKFEEAFAQRHAWGSPDRSPERCWSV